MLRSLKSKITLALTLGVILIMVVSSFSISAMMDRNLQESITKDLRPIVNYSKESINSLIALEEKNNMWNTLNKVSSLFNVYIGFIGGSNEEAGKVILIEPITQYKKSDEKKDSILKIKKDKDILAATLLYPLYNNEEYIGNIIIQKDYSNIYLANTKLLRWILIIQGILTVLLIFAIYFIVKEFTKPLEKLVQSMKNFGAGKDVKDIHTVSNDEVGALSKEFNNMKNNITKLQSNQQDFFNNATHELKTPLTAIRGYSQMLQEEDFEDEFVNRAVVRLEEESIKMNKLVENLLLLSREEAKVSGKPEELELSIIVKDILKSFDLRIEAGKYNVIFNEVSRIGISAVKEDIETIITNLIDNSLKYSEDKKVEIVVGGDNELFSISNKVVSLNEDIKDNLLEPFIKGVKNNKEVSSSGLGLYICKRICDRNNLGINYDISEDNIRFIINKKIL